VLVPQIAPSTSLFVTGALEIKQSFAFFEPLAVFWVGAFANSTPVTLLQAPLTNQRP
jgi:hypothetical protein